MMSGSKLRRMKLFWTPTPTILHEQVAELLKHPKVCLAERVHGAREMVVRSNYILITLKMPQELLPYEAYTLPR
jgi:hypothetical protein